MSALSTVHEYRALGDSWSKAIRSSWEPKAWLGVRLNWLGDAISHTGDHLQGQCDCKD